MLSTNSYLVVTPDNYFLCNDIRHIINTIKHYCFRLNATQLKSFNSCIRTHINNNDFINADIYVIKLDKCEIKLFY